ncbi:MAG TPA: MarR family transcriptional regulator [Candidatus Dormibacteraeota bacterium]|jgi:DNA-binding MarR family transcriptional regulator
MKGATNEWTKRLVVATDERGHLYSPRMREGISERVPAEALNAVEAFAAIGMAARLLRSRMERFCEREGLSENRLGILFMLRHAGEGVPLGALAARLQVSPRNVTGLIDHLERDGLVERVPDPADRRSVLAHLTDMGRERVDAMSDVTFRQQQGFLAGFTDEELRQLRHLCLKLVSNMQEADLPD